MGRLGDRDTASHCPQVHHVQVCITQERQRHEGVAPTQSESAGLRTPRPPRLWTWL